jgi:hypothetical protein
MRRLVERKIGEQWKELREKVDALISELINEQVQKYGFMATEETCEVHSPIVYMEEDMGLSTNYYFSLPWGTVFAWSGDDSNDPDDFDARIERFTIGRKEIK